MPPTVTAIFSSIVILIPLLKGHELVEILKCENSKLQNSYYKVFHTIAVSMEERNLSKHTHPFALLSDEGVHSKCIMALASAQC